MAITFISPIIKHPVGGIKVMYQFAEMLNSMGFESEICHPEDHSFSCAWFEHKAKIRTNSNFNPKTDFLVIPEILAAEIAMQCRSQNLKYAIFVQNATLIPDGIGKLTSSDLESAYMHADVILSISDYVTRMILLKYPHLESQKIIQLSPVIHERFSDDKKEKVISYMPRKLPGHEKYMRFLLDDQISANWTIVPIENMSEIEVASILARSSIFLSFSDQEGLGLPPIEAGISGNIVVGYSGFGGHEYFQKPIFREVSTGDYELFHDEVLIAIKDVNNKYLESADLKIAQNNLRIQYSRENSLKKLAFFGRVVDELF
jgi:hypothetical protein